MVNIVVLWQTVYTQHTLDHLADNGYGLVDEVITHREATSRSAVQPGYAAPCEVIQ